ncbi:MAG TPA: class I tRNA ligase family protein [Anaerolineae bacterium]|nr:class I tRNA ligase family protein [Anaerolineae bacterium]HQH38232.1 class I tRNA ligase family protein [Anaerolineae bacterium]
MFKPVQPQVDFVAQEHDVLDFWDTIQAFQELHRLRQDAPRWSFIDGPITANNPMGIHHGWGRTYKDLWQRYWAMRGYQERYQNGFDCQGLWVEVEVEKEKEFTSKRDIETYGLAPFVLECKARVLRQAAKQTEQSIRLGYWMDWNDPETLRAMADKLLENPAQEMTVDGPDGPVTDSVERLVGRLGMPELGGSYFTFATENNYTIWTFIKKVWERGWLYRGHDVMPWCPRCETGLSQHEIVTDGYRELTHNAPVVCFPLRGRAHEALLVWTTTPWTLTSNVAAAVGPELTYVKVQAQDGWTYYLAKGTLENVMKGKYEVLGELKGQEMVGWEYDGPFDELPAVQKMHVPDFHRVIPWDEVGEVEGTGIVHIAPGCGAEDFELGKEFNLPALAPLTEDGAFLEGFGWLTGRDVHAVAPDIFHNLDDKEVLYRVDSYTHRYPVCWRCDTPLVFRLVDEWFIRMGRLYDKPREELTAAEKSASLRYQIMDVVDQIRWIPEFGYAREMDWLHNMQDWMISKKRYWGLALPIWVCDNKTCEHFEVLGDEDELRARAIAGWDVFAGHTPHRPYIDAVKIACPKCGSPMTRIADVGNPWLDAGSVAYSTTRYRTDRAYWAKWVPADWISESFPGQFRNWFYSLITMSTVFEQMPPTKVVHGYSTLVAENGLPMHKSWGNAIWFDEVAENIGVDTMRWLFMNQPLDQNLVFGYHRADETRRRFIIPLWNTYAFFITYARIDEWTPSAELLENPSKYEEGQPNLWIPWTETATPTVLDKWIIARLRETIVAMTEGYETYIPLKVAQPAEAFLDDLSNWYVRRSRRRFWATRGASASSDADKEAAYQTLYTVLLTFAKLLAPVLPFMTEVMYQNLVRAVDATAPESIHHCLIPTAEPLDSAERVLVEAMTAVRQAATLGHSVRAAGNLKVRQPLRQALIAADPRRREALNQLLDLLADELNVKDVAFVAEEGELVEYKLLPLNRVLGPKFGQRFPFVRKALERVDAARAVAQLHAGHGLTLPLDDGSEATLKPDEVLVQSHAREGYGVAGEGGLVVALDTTVTPELEQEGLAREVVRRVQDLRKQADYQLTDRIVVQYNASGALAEAVAAQREMIAAEVLADALEAVASPAGDKVLEDTVDDEPLVLAVKRIV